MYAIETSALSKKYGGSYAVRDLNIHVPDGAIYGFIGENGSGKSTTEKLISGLINPTSGKIRLYGNAHTQSDVRETLGVLIETPACFPDHTVFDNLMMQAINIGISNPKSEVERVLKLVHMVGAARNKFKHCSLGMKQRIGLAQALMGHPKLLILDEPINGLDADGVRIVRETLLKINREEGVTILISSHILGELEKIATHYGIIRKGTLIQEMTAKELKELCPNFVVADTDNNKKAEYVLSGFYERIETAENGIRIYDAHDTAEISVLLYKNGVRVSRLGTEHIGLEEYYTRAVREVG